MILLDSMASICHDSIQARVKDRKQRASIGVRMRADEWSKQVEDTKKSLKGNG